MTERDGLVYDMPDAEYHAGTELSSTGARTLLDSPARFKHRMDHPIRGAALDLGTITHALVLGTPNPAQVIEGGRGKAEREREARAAGKIPVLAEDYAVVTGMAEAALAHPTARHILQGEGNTEVSVFATDPDTGVRTRARFDFLGHRGQAADLKTTAGSASASGFGQSAAKFNYPVQEAHYLETLRWAGVDDPGPMDWIVVEKSAPHLVAVHRFDEAVRDVGRTLAARAREIYAECVASDIWPGYGEATLYTEFPAWFWNAVDNEEEEIRV